MLINRQCWSRPQHGVVFWIFGGVCLFLAGFFWCRADFSSAARPHIVMAGAISSSSTSSVSATTTAASSISQMTTTSSITSVTSKARGAASPASVSGCATGPTCLWVEMTGTFGRLGNYVAELNIAWELVARCGGVVVPLDFRPLKVPLFVSPHFADGGVVLSSLRCRKVRLPLIDLFFKRYPAWLNEMLPRCNCSSQKRLDVEPMLRPNVNWLTGNKWNEKHLSEYIVVHLRGGDIMTHNAHEMYWQPPCSYYRNAIEHSGLKRLLIVSEDSNNPCFNSLKQLPGAETAVTDVATSYFLLLNSVTLVLGNSFFSRTPALLSKTLRRLYMYEYADDPFYNDFVLFASSAAAPFSRCTMRFELKGMVPWKLSPQQLALIRSLPSSQPECTAAASL